MKKFNVKLQAYSKWCSASCQATDSECIAKLKSTLLSKYGDENYNGKEKRAETLSALSREDPEYWSKRVAKGKVYEDGKAW